MGKKELLMRKNIKRFKSREKKFYHFADYLITFATLFGLSSNTWINLINSKQEKYTINLFIALVIEFLYITAISMKITSHYPVKAYKAYIIAYKKKEKEIRSKLKEQDQKKLNLLINKSLVSQINIKWYLFFMLLIILSIFLYEVLMYYLILPYKSNGLFVAIIILYMFILVPLTFIPVIKIILQYYLIIGIPENRFTKFIKKYFN